jgi:hypothetical protein
MARISLHGHWKFRRLVCAIESLNDPATPWPTDASPIARGILELLWEAGYTAVSEYVGTPAEVAAIVHWRGDPLVLVTLLVDAGFLEATAPSEYAIHDLWDHAPRYVQLSRGRKRRASTASDRQDGPIESTLQDGPIESRRTKPVDVHVGPITSLLPRLGKEQRKSSDAGASRPAQPVEKNDAVLVPLGYELVRQGKRFDNDADLKDALKDLAARYNVAYDAASIARALDALKHAKAPLWFTSEVSV